jgi:hypothetical protein
MSININLEIEKLTTQYNNALKSLAQQLTNNINIINKYRVSNSIKNMMINNLRITYNNNVARLTKEYNMKKQQLQNMNTNNKYALLVGINYRGTPYELYGCINDTTNCKEMLQTKYGYNNFIVITDETNKKPTRQTIISELTNLLRNSRSGDKLFFLFSGHGTSFRDQNGDETDNQDEVIVPLDLNCIIDDELFNIIKNNLKTNVSLFMLFDCCFSGTICDLKYNHLPNAFENNVELTNGNVIVISGCKDNQTSADAFVSYNGKDMSAGAMTFSFLQSITESPNTSLRSLLENMRNILNTNGFDQIPQLSSGKQIDINMLVKDIL